MKKFVAIYMAPIAEMDKIRANSTPERLIFFCAGQYKFVKCLRGADWTRAEANFATGERGPGQYFIPPPPPALLVLGAPPIGVFVIV
jgi:hypothetical protein